MVMVSMAKRKKKIEKIEEEIEFDIEKAYAKVNPNLVEGLKRYIFENGLVIKTQNEFNELLEHYGGFKSG